MVYDSGMSDSPELPLRPNVCILVFNREKKLLLAQRAGSPDIWQFPQGGVEFDQSIEGNVLREIEEELGLSASKVSIVAGLKSRNAYRWEIPPSYAAGVWSGQAQTFWVVRFLGEDSDIRLEGPDQELSAFQWCTPEEVRERADPKRRPGYEGALIEFEALKDTF